MYYISSNLLDDVHKVKAVFTGHTLCFSHLFKHTPNTRKYSKFGFILTCSCLKELFVTLKIIRTRRVQDIVSVMYVTNQRLCVEIKIWSCTLCSKNCHQTIFCLSRHFCTILTIFAKSTYHLVLIRRQLYFNFHEMTNCVTFSFSLKNTAYFFCVRNLIVVESIFMFSVPKFDL